MTRRMFEHLALLLFPLVYIGGLLAAALTFLRPLAKRPSLAKLQLPEVRSYFDDAEKYVEVEFNGKKVYVLKVGDTLRAFDAQCTHLDCNVEYKEGGFHCPCHNGAFDSSGIVTRKPPQKPLREFEIRVDEESGAVVINNKYINNPARAG